MEEQNRAFLKDEYLKLQDQYEDFDRRSLTIKGWVSAGAAVAFAAGFKPGEGFSLAQWISIGALALCFWYLEARWKQFQYALSGRIVEIEKYFRDEGPLPKPLQIYSGWFQHYRRTHDRAQLWQAARQDFVMLPYALIVAICVIGFTATLLET